MTYKLKRKEYNASKHNMPGNIATALIRIIQTLVGWVQIKDWPFWIAQVNVPNNILRSFQKRTIRYIYDKEEGGYTLFWPAKQTVFSISDKSLNQFGISTEVPSSVQTSGILLAGQWDGLNAGQ
jgi:hypothetical protein